MHSENEVVYLYLDDIIPNRFQPRELFDERALKELAVSIKEHGVIQPIIVRKNGEKYEIIAGERRYKASALAGLTKIPAIIRDLDDKESSKVALLENLQRKNLNPIEEAKTYQKILEINQMTQEELAKTMGKSQSAVANKLRLLSLSEAVQNALLNTKISEKHARTLLTVHDKEEQERLVKQVIQNHITVRELERIIKQEQEMPEEIEREEPEPINSINKEDKEFREPIFDDEGEDDDEDNGEYVKSRKHTPPMPDTMIDYSDDSDELDSSKNKKSKKQEERDGSNFRPMMDTPTAPPNYGEIDPDLRLQEEEEENPEEKFQFTNTDVPSNTSSSSNDDFFARDDSKNRDFSSNGSSLDSLLNISTPKSNKKDNDRRERPKKEKRHDEIDDLYSDINDEDYENIDFNDIERKYGKRDDSLEDKEEKYSVHPSRFDESLFKSPTIEDFEEKNKTSELKADFSRPSSYRGALRKELNPEEEEEEKKPKKSVNSDVQTGINAIRDTVRRLEQANLEIDTDEMNFENSYQIVIKIQKPVPEDEQ